MTEDAPLASFEFRRGAYAGSHLALFPSALVHRNADGFETIPLARISALGVAFERDQRRIAWGSVLLLIAGLLLLAYLPLRTLIGSALAEATLQAQGGGFFPSALRFLDFCVAVLPFASAVIALWAAAWLVLGWIGDTVLRVVIAPAERVFSARGRDSLLLEFAESVSSCLGKNR